MAAPDDLLPRLDYSLRRYHVDCFLTSEVARLPARARVLDIGGVTVGKRGGFDVRDYDLRVVVVNLVAGGRPDILSDVGALPFEDGSFDAVVCSEVLEHVLEPRAAVSEIARVLRSGSVALLTAPFLFRIHPDPHDYGRYTDQYWREVLDAAGFGEVAVAKHGLFWTVLVEMMRSSANERRVGGRLGGRYGTQVVEHASTWAKRWALQRDAAADPGGFLGSFTTGFGIRAVRE